MENETSVESLEESVFKSLNHQKRRDILRLLGERGGATFTEIKNDAGLEDSPSLSYHLSTMKELVEQKGGKYYLTEIGLDSYNLICKASSYSASSSLLTTLRKELVLVVIANAVLWAAALFAVREFEGTLNRLTIFSLSALWLVSNSVLYSIVMRTRKRSAFGK
jgi:DNA-binding transcriptional ArsR family regulator